jgi:hypothetical protein
MNVVAAAQFRGRDFTEAAPRHDAVPLRPALPRALRVFP